jgi:hypothetical protein
VYLAVAIGLGEIGKEDVAMLRKSLGSGRKPLA